MSEFVEEDWVNELGQTISPGDKVIAIGTSYKTTNIMVGVFEGVRYDTWDTSEFVLDANGEKIKGPHGYFERKIVSVRGVGSVRVGQIPTRRFKYDYVAKTGEWIDTVKKANLPLKRVFKIDTPVERLTKISL